MIALADKSEFKTYFMKDGYLDDVFDVLDAHRHPCILLGRFALLWMGAAVFQESVSCTHSPTQDTLI